MLTLDEAIVHARKVANQKRKDAERADAYNLESEGCYKCAEEYEQLVEWLEELKRYKNQKLIIKVKPDEAQRIKKILQESQWGIVYPNTQYEVVPLISCKKFDEDRNRELKETADMLQIILNNAESYKYGALFNKEGVLVKNVKFNGSFDWVLERAVKLLREEIT